MRIVVIHCGDQVVAQVLHAWLSHMLDSGAAAAAAAELAAPPFFRTVVFALWDVFRQALIT